MRHLSFSTLASSHHRNLVLVARRPLRSDFSPERDPFVVRGRAGSARWRLRPSNHRKRPYREPHLAPRFDPSISYPAEVVRVIDGDTFEARVRVWPGLDVDTKVRLRGIDAAELHARCGDELTQAASGAHQRCETILAEGDVQLSRRSASTSMAGASMPRSRRATPRMSRRRCSTAASPGPTAAANAARGADKMPLPAAPSRRHPRVTAPTPTTKV